LDGFGVSVSSSPRLYFVNSRGSGCLVPFLEVGVRKSGDDRRFCVWFSRVFSEGDPALNGVDALDGARVIRSMVSRSEGNSWASMSGKPERRFCGLVVAFDCGDHSSAADLRDDSEFEASGGAWTPAKLLDCVRFASSLGRSLVFEVEGWPISFFRRLVVYPPATA
jgi:hypothetical protein